MDERPLKSGAVAYYWQPPRRDVKKGFKLGSVALGNDYAAAQARAGELNVALASWRLGLPQNEDLLGSELGTFKWLFDAYYETTAFLALRPSTQAAYRQLVKRALKLKSKEGRALAEYRLKALTPLAADRIYQRLVDGPRGEAIRVANFTVTVIKRSWRIVRRQYPQHFPAENPWTDLIQRRAYKPKKAASRKQAHALSAALKKLGHPHLGLVPLVCYEWFQRPQNVLSGSLKWSDWRPAEYPDRIRIEHAKTGAEVWLPLQDGKTRLFAEIEAYLESLEKLGDVIVMIPGLRGASRPYSFDYANRRMREARVLAELPDYVTFDACRHGGMTELGDADATEAQIMALSGHNSPDAARRYIKRTEAQRLAAMRKRRILMNAARPTHDASHAWHDERAEPDSSEREDAAIRDLFDPVPHQGREI